MDNSIERLQRIKVDALYGKKKHFNAADRIESYHYKIGVPLVVINVVSASILFYVLTDSIESWVKYIPLALTLITAILSGLQTYFNYPQKIEGHRRIANRYLTVSKSCDRLKAYMTDNLLPANEAISKIEAIAIEIGEINKDAEVLPTSQQDYLKAKQGIEAGEENYTEQEKSL